VTRAFMALRIVDEPAKDPQWSSLVDRHPAASVFHSPGWLRTLQQTYGYQPFVVTASPESTIDNGMVVCPVNGWPSRRLVSLPFSDHCAPLLEKPDDLTEMLPYLIGGAGTGGSASVELRPRDAAGSSFESAAGVHGLRPGGRYALHRLDLRPPEAAIFHRFHHSARRAVRRADREGLTYEAGTSERLLGRFYRLLRMTRRRHRLPPQPLAWFRNLLANLGDGISIHVASIGHEPIASMLTLSFKQIIYYKYGGSDASRHRLGGMPFLFWRVIRDARSRGFEEFDLGRSDLDQPGLIAFKEHLGAASSALTYYGYPVQRRAAHHSWMSRLARGTVAYLPDAALDLAGRLIYRRLG
jgi:hypothetical protein